MKLVLDMNISPLWVPALQQGGHSAVHWSVIGAPAATDQEILDWAKANQHIVFTHDLDFGAILAATKADSPSVIQLRSQDILPAASGPLLLRVLDSHRSQLEDGALVSLDTRRARVHILPIEKFGR